MHSEHVFFRRFSLALLALILVCTAAVRAYADSGLTPVKVTLWKTGSRRLSIGNGGIDQNRTAEIREDRNGRITLRLPIRTITKVGVTGHLTGISIDGTEYKGRLEGDLSEGTGVLVLERLPHKVLTADDDPDHGVYILCLLSMDSSLIGPMSPSARLTVSPISK